MQAGLPGRFRMAMPVGGLVMLVWGGCQTTPPAAEPQEQVHVQAEPTPQPPPTPAKPEETADVAPIAPTPAGEAVGRVSPAMRERRAEPALQEEPVLTEAMPPEEELPDAADKPQPADPADSVVAAESAPEVPEVPEAEPPPDEPQVQPPAEGGPETEPKQPTAPPSEPKPPVAAEPTKPVEPTEPQELAETQEDGEATTEPPDAPTLPEPEPPDAEEGETVVTMVEEDEAEESPDPTALVMGPTGEPLPLGVERGRLTMAYNPTTASGRGVPTLDQVDRPCAWFVLDGKKGHFKTGKLEWYIEEPVSARPSFSIWVVEELVGELVNVRIILRRLMTSEAGNAPMADDLWQYRLEARADGLCEMGREYPLCTTGDVFHMLDTRTREYVEEMPELPPGDYVMLGDITGTKAPKKSVLVTRFTVAAEP